MEKPFCLIPTSESSSRDLKDLSAMVQATITSSNWSGTRQTNKTEQNKCAILMMAQLKFKACLAIGNERN